MGERNQHGAAPTGPEPSREGSLLVHPLQISEEEIEYIRRIQDATVLEPDDPRWQHRIGPAPCDEAVAAAPEQGLARRPSTTGEHGRALAEAQTDAMNLAHRFFGDTTPAVHWRELKTIADTYYAPVCRQHTEAERRAAEAEREVVDLTWQRRRAEEEANRWRRIAERLETEKQEEREACATICDARAKYFDQAPAHREWADAARSYRATAKDIRDRSWKAASTASTPAPSQQSEVRS